MEMETQMIHRGNKFPVEKPAADVAHYPKNSDSFCRFNDFRRWLRCVYNKFMQTVHAMKIYLLLDKKID